MPDPSPTDAESAARVLRSAAQLHREGNWAQAEALYLELKEKPSVRFDALHMLGVLRAEQRRPAEALDDLRAALEIRPGHGPALSNLGLVLASLGRHAEALANYDAALAAQPDMRDAWNNRGNALMCLGRLHEALESFERALAIDSGFAEAHNNCGHALHALKRPAEALASHERSIACRPGFVAALRDRGVVLLELERPAEALTSLDQAIDIAPDPGDAHAYRGNALMKLGRVEEALESFDRALAGRADYAIALSSRGNALAELGRFEEALASFDRALRTPGDFPELLNNRGSVLRKLKRPAEALESFERALALRPSHVAAHNNRGNALRDLERLDDAIVAYEVALTIDPDFAEAWNNLGATHLELTRVEKAVACFDRVVALKPDYAEARLNRALAKLFRGDFAAAREDYEHRWRVKIAPPSNRVPGVPDWNGEDLRGRRIVIYEEQGLGDVIQFFRFLPRLLAQGAEVAFLVRHSLRRLFSPYAAIIALLEAPPPGARFDYQCALMSLPGVLGTTLETTPGDVPYLFAEPALVAKWRAAIGEAGVKIGLCWQGSVGRPIDVGRSLPLAAFEPLSRLPGVRLISLQRHHGVEQLSTLPAGMDVETLGPEFDASPGFEDTAAVMACLDLVISCDTSVAHAAGALGRPVWVALKQASEWRWRHDRADSAWYPTARLYRQSVRNDWRPVMQRIAADAAQAFAPAAAYAGVDVPPRFHAPREVL